MSCYPNAGLPNAIWGGGYDEKPDDTARNVLDFAKDNLVNIIGGCCGAMDFHIAACARVLADAPPSPVSREAKSPDNVAQWFASDCRQIFVQFP